MHHPGGDVSSNDPSSRKSLTRWACRARLVVENNDTLWQFSEGKHPTFLPQQPEVRLDLSYLSNLNVARFDLGIEIVAGHVSEEMRRDSRAMHSFRTPSLKKVTSLSKEK